MGIKEKNIFVEWVININPDGIDKHLSAETFKMEHSWVVENTKAKLVRRSIPSCYCIVLVKSRFAA